MSDTDDYMADRSIDLQNSECFSAQLVFCYSLPRSKTIRGGLLKNANTIKFYH